MKNIFIAFIFILFDFAITLDSCRIGLIPSCVGYWFLAKGIPKLAEKAPSCQKIIPYIKPMMLFTAVLYILDLIGFSQSIISFVLGLVSLTGMFYISYHVVKGIQELQQVYHANLNAGKLYASWKMFAVFTGAAYVLIFIPLVNLACMLLGIIASVIFLISIYQSMELYNIIPKNQDTYNQNTYNNDVYPPKMF